mmetsp:Transcript_14014/g.28694  ORF Transcript_14014/g.28694 Transcript_14014/m.28694 type:complete len:279 (-) Transcript_14014:106-942(-)
MEARHEEEREEVRKKADRMRSMVPRKDRLGKQRVNEEIAALEEAMRARHLEEAGESSVSPIVPAENIAEENLDSGDGFYGKGRSLSRAQKRRVKRQEEEAETERRLQQEKATAGPGLRELEERILRSEFLEPNGWSIHQIPPDGDCLFSSICHQIKIRGMPRRSAIEIRELAATHILRNAEDFAPFLDLDKDGDGDTTHLEQYCEKMRTPGVWGGQLEIRAIAEALQVPIEVISAGMPPLRMGPDRDDHLLRLSYHRNHFGLGEHYNSVVDAESAAVR